MVKASGTDNDTTWHSLTEEDIAGLAADLTARLQLAGGTMTGALVLNANPTAALGAATKQYVDAETTRAQNAEALLLPLAGGQMTGTVGMNQAPTTSQIGMTITTDDAGVYVTNSNPGGNTTGAALTGSSAAAAGLLLGSQVTGDTFKRFTQSVDGKKSWGSGTAARDTNLYRAAAGVLATDNSLDVGAHALGIWTPRESGFVAATGDPRTVPSGTTPVGGTIYLSSLFVARATAVTKIWWGLNAAGATPTASANWIALVDPNGNILASVNIDGRITATGVYTETIASQNLTPGQYRVAFLFNASTLPQPYRHSGLAANLVNAGISVPAAYLHATNGTGATALPASFTLSSNGASSFAYWCALS